MDYARNGPIAKGGIQSGAHLPEWWDIRREHIAFIDHIKPFGLWGNLKRQFSYDFEDDYEPPHVRKEKYNPHFMCFSILWWHGVANFAHAAKKKKIDGWRGGLLTDRMTYGAGGF